MSRDGDQAPRPEVIRPTPWEQYIERMGWPVVTGPGIRSLEGLELQAGSAGDGLKGAFLQLAGMEGLTEITVVDFPPGWSSDWTHHLYEKWVVVLSGRCRLDLRSRERTIPPAELSLGPMSVAAVPLNMEHRFRNAGADAARLAYVTNAPLYMDLLGLDAVFDIERSYPDREAAVLGADPSVEIQAYKDYDGRSGHRLAHFGGAVVEDVSTVALHPGESLRGEGFDYLSLEKMGGGLLGSHVGQMNPRSMSNAHYHMGGAILLCVGGQGYTLAWPQGAGRRPYESGNEHLVRRQDFVTTGVVAVGTEWYHQHVNPSPTPLRHLAFRYGKTSPATFVRAHHYQPGEGATGRILPIDELDPRIHKDYEAAMQALAQ